LKDIFKLMADKREFTQLQIRSTIPWYNKLAGTWFQDHPNQQSNVQKGRYFVTEKNDLTAGIPDSFERTDEFYAFKNISENINVVIKIDKKPYIGGTNGDNHPMSWYQEFGGERSFYTAMGHTDETYLEPLFLNHLWAGIKYATGGAKQNVIDFSKVRPEENRFTKMILKEKLDEPIELTLLDENRVLFIQRKGEVKLYNPRAKYNSHNTRQPEISKCRRQRICGRRWSFRIE